MTSEFKVFQCVECGCFCADEKNLFDHIEAWHSQKSKGIEMNSFITGSHAYGIPKPDSDLDLVVLVSSKEATLLWQQKDEGSKSPRYNKLNLIIFETEKEGDVDRYVLWKQINDELIARKPVSREEAVEAFKASGAAGGFDNEISGGLE